MAVTLSTNLVLDLIAASFITNAITEGTKVGLGRLRPDFLAQCKPTLNPNTNEYDCTSSAARGSRVAFPSGHTSQSFVVAAFISAYLVYRWYIQPATASSHPGRSDPDHHAEATVAMVEVAGDRMQSNASAGDTEVEISLQSATAELDPPKGTTFNNRGDADRQVTWLQSAWREICDALKILAVLAPFAIAWSIGCTRISDNRHREVDVAAGAFIGLWVGVLFAARSLCQLHAAVKMAASSCSPSVSSANGGDIDSDRTR